MRQEAKHMEEELEPTSEDQQKFVTRVAQAVPEVQVTQEAKKTEPKKAGSLVGQIPRQSLERTGPTIPKSQGSK